MCVLIDADCIMANLFADGREFISIRDLKQIRWMLEKEFDDVFIDISMPAIYFAISMYPDMFKWNDYRIQPVLDSASEVFSTDYINNMFNWRIPDEIRSTLIDKIIKFK